MGANIAGIYGAQIFRSDDRPRYRRAFSVGIGILTFGLFMAGMRYIDDVVRRRRNKGAVEQSSDESTGARSDGRNTPDATYEEKGVVFVGGDAARLEPPSSDQAKLTSVLAGSNAKPFINNGI